MIIGLLIAAAVTLFLTSLPFGGTAIGGTLKRWAGFAFLLALIPSMCFDMTRIALRNHPTWTPGTVALEVLTVLIVSAIAFVALAVRKAVASGGEEPRKRLSTKQPMTPPGARSDLFNMLRDELRGGDDGE
jgi:multisubunit Na+/H+ antiporter MnhF subunit